MVFYRFVQWLVRTLRPVLVGPLEVEGMEHIPEDGPFLLVANHQSYLDPVLIESLVRRPVHTMAKSTQFNDRVVGTLLRWLKTFPVRRFEIDPQAVRLVLRYLEAGHGVGIYIEGERSWDGRLQAPRLGTIRVILKAGVPVIPCGISGSYDVWPRWHGRIQRGTVRIRFGEPMRFPRLDDRAERDQAVPQAGQRLMDAIRTLMAAG